MRFAKLTGRLLTPADRLVAALTNPARRNRVMLAVIACYVVLWTFYGVVAKSGQDLHVDMTELVAWSREPALGYWKHPPLGAWVTMVWFAAFPATDWSYYLFAMVVIGVALSAAWHLLGRVLDDEKRVIGIAMLMFIPFFNFHALKFNVNTILIPLWAVTILFFLRSFEHRRKTEAALAGLLAAACMLGKYWSIFLLLGLGLAALADSRRAAYFGSSAPWITTAVGTLALVPHLIWLVADEFSPFSYALSIHGRSTFFDILRASALYLAGAAGYAAPAIVVALAATRPNSPAFGDTLAPATSDRRLVAIAFWMPLLIPAIAAPLLGFGINSLWTMAGWVLLPVVLLSSPFVSVTRIAATRIVFIAILFPFVALAASPLIAYAIHKNRGVTQYSAHLKLLTERVGHYWRLTTDRPLLFVGGDATLVYGTAFYLPGRPSTYPELDRRAARWIDEKEVKRKGIALLCPAEFTNCVEKSVTFAGNAGRRFDFQLTRSYFGIVGPTATYVIVIAPPEQ